MPELQVPIIDQLVHPSYSLLTQTQVPGSPFTDFVSSAPPQSPLALTYGIRVVELVRPAGWGRKLGNPQMFNPHFVQVATVYQLGGGVFGLVPTGPGIFRDVATYSYSPFAFFWSEPLPTLVTLWIEPGWTLDVFWLQT